MLSSELLSKTILKVRETGQYETNLNVISLDVSNSARITGKLASVLDQISRFYTFCLLGCVPGGMSVGQLNKGDKMSCGYVVQWKHTVVVTLNT